MVIKKIMDKNVTTISINFSKIFYIYMGLVFIYCSRRIRFLMQRMDLAVIVDPAAQQGLEKVFFGAWVTLLLLNDDREHTYRIVGKDELQPSLGYISWVSPLARALLGKQIGDTVKVSVPAGEEEYEIIDVQYNPPD